MTHIQRTSTLLFVVVMISGGVLLTPFSVAKAQPITQQQIDQQHVVVRSHLEDTLREQVKLLQMILIRHLEARLVQLQALQGN